MGSAGVLSKGPGHEPSEPGLYRTQIPEAWSNFCIFIRVTRGQEQQDTSPSCESLLGKAILPPLQFWLLAWAEGPGVARTLVQATGWCYLWPWLWGPDPMCSRMLMACFRSPSTLRKYTPLSTRFLTALQQERPRSTPSSSQ